MISYELHGYNSIKSVILYMMNNIYVCHLHEHSFTIVLHYVLIRSAYPAMRSYQYSYIPLPFGAAPVGDIFHKKKDELFGGNA